MTDADRASSEPTEPSAATPAPDATPATGAVSDPKRGAAGAGAAAAAESERRASKGSTEPTAAAKAKGKANQAASAAGAVASVAGLDKVGKVAKAATSLTSDVEKVSGKEDAKALSKDLATGVAQGAAAGGLAGAAAGAAKGLGAWAATSARGRKGAKTLGVGVILGVSIPVLIPLALILVLVFTSINGVTSLGTRDDQNVQQISQAAAAEDTGLDAEAAAPVYASAEAAQVPWQVVLAATQEFTTLQFTETANVSDAERTDERLARDAMARMLARGLSSYSGGAGALTLGAGTVQTADGAVVALDPGSATGAEGEVVDGDLARAAARTRTAYVAAIAALPIVGMDEARADKIFRQALGWYLGVTRQPGMCAADPVTGGVTTLAVTWWDGSTVTLEAEQLANAGLIIGSAAADGEPAQRAALATAIVESGLKNWANDGTYNFRGGGNLTSEQWAEWSVKIVESLNYPHQAVGSDFDSIGMFQQRPSMGWGTIPELMDPAFATGKFLERLRSIEGWQNLDVGVVSQKVQGSAFPERYAKAAQAADTIMANVKGTSCAPAGVDGGGTWTHPTPNQSKFWNNFGQDRGSYIHGGEDLSAPMGSPIVAASTGVVEHVSCSRYKGRSPCNIAINHGGGIYTLYVLMYPAGVLVQTGQSVNTGDLIGTVGSNGNSSGPHNHFEIWVDNKAGPLSGHFVDPVDFLAERCVSVWPVGTMSGCTPPGGAAEQSVSGALDWARTQIGKTYILGANGPNAWDCSSLVQAAYRNAGLTLPRTSREQYVATTRIDASQVQPGDLIFWSSNGTPGGIYHVGIYAGPEKVMHAANPTKGVLEAGIYNKDKIIGYGRVG